MCRVVDIDGWKHQKVVQQLLIVPVCLDHECFAPSDRQCTGRQGTYPPHKVSCIGSSRRRKHTLSYTDSYAVPTQPGWLSRCHRRCAGGHRSLSAAGVRWNMSAYFPCCCTVKNGAKIGARKYHARKKSGGFPAGSKISRIKGKSRPPNRRTPKSAVEVSKQSFSSPQSAGTAFDARWR